MNRQLKEFILEKKHHIYREENPSFLNDFIKENLSDEERIVRRFEILCKAQKPILFDFQQIAFMRTTSNFWDAFSNEEWDTKRKDHYIHESGYVSNLAPDYEAIIKVGLLAYTKDANDYVKREVTALLELVDRYKEKAKDEKRDDLVEVLTQVPRYPARNLKEAFQFFRILHFAYLLEGGYQIVAGRIDQFFYPYFKKDLEEGRLDFDSALDLVSDFFLSFNIDADLYDGVQQGDNGQSVVLGGLNLDGSDSFNELSKICLLASKRNQVIDPKINLRVHSKTTIETYKLASELTKVGLGFPQYLNDDIIIPALLDLGYDEKDAYNYAVAACWEIIIPRYGFEIVNIGAINFPKVLDDLLHENCHYPSFESLLENYYKALQKECDQTVAAYQNIYFAPTFLTDISLEPKYFNFGIHGTGISTIVDSLYAIKELVYNQKSISLEHFFEIVQNDFKDEAELLNTCRYKLKKMGQNDDEVDAIAQDLLHHFYLALKDYTNEFGGCVRAGTGTAMFYLDYVKDLEASFDGRRKNEPLSANYSVTLHATDVGPLSIINSFTKPNLKEVFNGGPLTLEFASSMFNDEDAILKLAYFVKAFIDQGGHQLQCNAVSLEKLKAAQEKPELYQNLIVRIWGWSAYFTELDKPFQDHVILRQEYSL